MIFTLQPDAFRYEEDGDKDLRNALESNTRTVERLERVFLWSNGMQIQHQSQPKPIMLQSEQWEGLAEKPEREAFTCAETITARKEQPLLIDVRAIKEMLNISEPTLWRLRRSGDFPDGILITPKMRRWYREDIVAWVAKKAGAQ